MSVHMSVGISMHMSVHMSIHTSMHMSVDLRHSARSAARLMGHTRLIDSATVADECGVPPHPNWPVSAGCGRFWA